MQKAAPKDAWPWLLALAAPFLAALAQRALTVGLDGRVDQLPLLLCAGVPLVGGAVVALAARPGSTLRTQLALPVPLHLAAWLLTALAIGNLGAKVAFTPTLALGAGLVGAVLWALAGQAFMTQEQPGLGLLTLGGFVLLLGRLSKSTEFAAWCWYVGLPLAALGLYWLTGPTPAEQASAATAEAAKKKTGAAAAKAKGRPSDDAAPYGLDVLGPLGVLAVVTAVALKNVSNDETSSLLQLGIASGALGVLAWGYRLTTQGRSLAFARLRDRLLLALGVAGAAGYCNFFHLHFNNFLHVWDTYHYYMGAKYFPELKYDRLYDCAVVADSEDGLREKIEKRTITDLRTNIIVKANTALEHPEACKGEFSAARWEAFKQDLRFFRGRVNDGRWDEIHHDHGFNATPVWVLVGYLVTNATVANTNQVTALNLIDPVYLLLTALILYWAFGPRVTAIGLIVVGTNWPSRFFYWTGGALLRHDWLFYTVAVICLLKKNKPGLAGAALAYAALLRLFPGLMLFGPLLAGAELFRRARLPLVITAEGADAAERDAARVQLKAFWRFIAGGTIFFTFTSAAARVGSSNQVSEARFFSTDPWSASTIALVRALPSSPKCRLTNSRPSASPSSPSVAATHFFQRGRSSFAPESACEV
jgi:hypothetical protein